MKSKDNPYNWDGQSKHHVPRAKLLSRVSEELLNGDHGYVLGCRGMGKSSFLRELIGSLKDEPVEVIYFPEPPTTYSIAHACKMLGNAVDNVCASRGVSPTCRNELQRYVEQEQLDSLLFRFMEELERKDPTLRFLILLLDELDGYAAPDSGGRPWGASFIDKLEGVRKRSQEKLVIFAAGGLSTAALDTLYLSTFFSRAAPELLEPFDFREVVALSEPYRTRGTPLTDEVIDMIRVTSGGNPALATFALEKLWDFSSPTPADVSVVMDRMRGRRGSIPSHIRGAIFDSSVSNGPKMVWGSLSRGDGIVPKPEIDAIIANSTGGFQNKAEWISTMLRTSGLIRADDLAFSRNPVRVEIIPSIMTLGIDADLGESLATADTLREQLIADLVDALTRLHRMSIDFFDSDNKIFPESVFSATLALCLELRGWRVVREANSAAGRTDLKARHDRFGEALAVVEVKIWPRNDYKDIHEQVVFYWSDGVEALATVMVAELQDIDWPKTYVDECLDGKTHGHAAKETVPALAAHFVAKTKNCTVEEVDHLLLRLAKRKKK